VIVWTIVLTTIVHTGVAAEIVDGFANRMACENAAVAIARQVHQQSGAARIQINCIEIDKGEREAPR
jgi:hypothetical protein